MSEQEEMNIQKRVCEGLKKSFEDLLRRKAALGQDMVFADENGKPRIVSACQALADYEARKAAENNSKE